MKQILINKLKESLNKSIVNKKLKRSKFTNDEKNYLDNIIQSLSFFTSFNQYENDKIDNKFVSDVLNNKYRYNTDSTFVEGTDKYYKLLENKNLRKNLEDFEIYKTKEEITDDVYIDTIDVYEKKNGYIDKSFIVIPRYTHLEPYDTFKIYMYFRKEDINGLKLMPYGNNYIIKYNNKQGKSICFEYVKFNELYVLKSLIDNGNFYYQYDILKNQTSHAILNLTTLENEINQIDNYFDIWNGLRNSVAHNEIIEYRIQNQGVNNCYGKLFKIDQNRIFITPFRLFQYLSLYTSNEIKKYGKQFKYYYLPFVNRQITNLEDINEYLKYCKTINISFKKDIYNKICSELDLQAKCKLQLTKDNDQILNVYHSIFAEKISNVNIKIRDFKVHKNILDYLNNKFLSNEIVSYKSYWNCLYYLIFNILDYDAVEESSTNNLKLNINGLISLFTEYFICSVNTNNSFDKINPILPDILSLCFSIVFAYINLIDNHFIDDLKNKNCEEKLGTLNFEDFKIIKNKLNSTIVSNVKTISEKEAILRAIRNDLSHNNLHIKIDHRNFLKSEFIFKLKDGEDKFVISILDFIDFITDFNLSQYISRSKHIIEANDFEDLKLKIKKFYQKQKEKK